MKYIATLAAVIFLSMASTDLGVAQPKPRFIQDAPLPAPEVYQQLLRDGLGGLLKDPYSAHFEFGEPYRVECRKNVFNTTEPWRGWAIDYTVNAKNSFGAYAGRERYFALIVNDGVRDGVAGYRVGFTACKKV